MEAYDVTVDLIFDWANEYASYDELEKVAKGIYGIYAAQRKIEDPAAHRKAKQYRQSSKDIVQ